MRTVFDTPSLANLEKWLNVLSDLKMRDRNTSINSCASAVDILGFQT
jgi:hypothetical protein